MIRGRFFRLCVILISMGAFSLTPLMAQQSSTRSTIARTMFLRGDYAECVKFTHKIASNSADFGTLGALRIRSLLATGKVREALKQARVLYARRPFDPELILAVAEAMRANGQTTRAESVIERVLAGPVPQNARALVAYGELMLRAGSDANEVMVRHFKLTKEADPSGRAAYLALGKLALATHDREFAAENFREGLKHFPNDPEFLLGMEKSRLPLPRAQQNPVDGITSYLDLALKENPSFAEALLLKADQLAGRKNFKESKATLDRALKVNPVHPEAWAQRAALALLEEDIPAAKKALKNARKYWARNPIVSETVGTTLAAHYRFAEAIEYLSQASLENPSSASIRLKLGSNQLRFGQLEEGWRNVSLAHAVDPYNVAAFNLITLRDKLKDYPVLERDGVMLRMSPEDMAVFGDRALALAVRSKQTLTRKYQVTLSQPVMVEMLPKQEDFAIRTFGLPGGESFLGVCFGPLITMTSPRGRLGRANWETVLWHEMAHTITLSGTRHRIPRWLTEGLSVYEERQVRPGWGQGMTASFRQRFMDEEMPTIVNLNESFAGSDIMFGYYHASLVTEFLVERFGFQAIRDIIADLGAGKPIEEVLAKRTAPLAELESSFRVYAKKVAEAYGPGLDWSPLTDQEYLSYRKDPAAWVSAHPKRYTSTMMLVSKLSEEEEWGQAKALLEEVIAKVSDNREEFNPYWALSFVCRNTGDEEGEREALTKFLEIDSNKSEAAARLLVLSQSLSVNERMKAADLMLEINPFQEDSYRTLLNAAKELEDLGQAQKSCASLLALEPRDSSRLHYELATMLVESDPDRARREVLKALEENPRFEVALEFLANLPPS